jgi:hypothetical protein
VLSIGTSDITEEADNTATPTTTPYERSSTVKIVEEDTSKRSEYYKELAYGNSDMVQYSYDH